MAFIAAAVAHRTGVKLDDIMGDSRARHIAEARMLCYALIRDLVPSKNMSQIGRFFKRDHTTVLSGYRRAGKSETILALRSELGDTLKRCFADNLTPVTE
jgi:chromosomal replication initiation ATPase DnaA